MVGRVRCTGGFEFEVGATFDGEAIGTDLADASEIEIISGYVEEEGAGSWVVGGAASDDGIVVEEMNVIERKFAVGEVKSGIELLNGLAVSGGIVEMDLSIAVRVGRSTRGLQEKIGRSGDGIVESGERLQARQGRCCEDWRGWKKRYRW